MVHLGKNKTKKFLLIELFVFTEHSIGMIDKQECLVSSQTSASVWGVI